MRGLTLLELIVALGLFGLLLLGAVHMESRIQQDMRATAQRIHQWQMALGNLPDTDPWCGPHRVETSIWTYTPVPIPAVWPTYTDLGPLACR